MSPRTLDDAFVIPQSGALQALDFVIRLDSERKADAVQRLVDDYVVTPAVAEALPQIFDHMKTTVARCEAYGHILHGGFGSGKSHLMTVVSLLLEGQEAAWAKDHPAFSALREQHRAWVSDANLLVVRVHMLSAKWPGAGLDDIVYGAVNEALKARGCDPLLVSGAAEVAAQIQNEADTYGEAFWKNARAAGVLVSQGQFDKAVAKGGTTLERLAGAYLKWKGLGAQAQGLKPPWGEGLKRLARHVKAQGFGGLVLLIDEFLLWLAEKAGDAFVTAINDMNTIVDFGGRREAPVVVVFARQRNIREFFPDLTDQDRIQEHLDHHKERFSVTQLQDVELRYIVKGRVLRDQTDPAAIAQARKQAVRQYKQAIDALVGEAGPAVLEDVYPFHPALIDVLVDVSNLMQRERSALRLLYELLAANRDLPLGELLPVGRVFEHVFPPAGVDAARKTEVLQRIHKEWYGSLAAKVDHYVARQAASGEPVSDERAQALRQALKTVLLGLVSPRLAGKGNERLTVARLATLNFADADGNRLRQKISRLSTDLRDFSLYYATELQLTGEKGDAVVSYALGQASLSELVRRAEAKVDNDHSRLAVLGERLDALLPSKLRGLVSSGGDGMAVDVIWRGTKRRGRVLFGNVREASQKSFRLGSGEDFRLLVDYPWDKPGFTVGEDIARVANARKKFGNEPTSAWLPRHFDTQEMKLVRELAALRWLLDEGAAGELLASYGSTERTHLLEQARTRATTLQKQVDSALLDAYDKQAEVKTLIGPRDPDLGTGSLEGDFTRLAREILDRRFPQHPRFERSPDDKRHEVKKATVAKVEAFLREAWGESGSVHFSADTADALSRIAKPLELAEVGQSRAQISHHGRFVKAVEQELGDHREVAWAPIADKLREAPYGLPDEVIDLLLVYVCLRGYRAKARHGDPVDATVGVGTRAWTLQKAELLDLAPWSRAKSLAAQLLSEQTTDAHRSLSAQDQLAERLSVAAKAARDDLQGLHARLMRLGAVGSERLAEIKTLMAHLAPLVTRDADSYARLSGWLEAWPDDDAALRAQLLARGHNLAALDELNERDRKLLAEAKDTALAEQIVAALDGLDERLQGREQVRPLRRVDIDAFNDQAHAIVAELLRQPPVQPPVQPPGGNPPVYPTGAGPRQPQPFVNPPPPDWGGPKQPSQTVETVRLEAPDEAALRSLYDDLMALHRAGRLVALDVSKLVKTEGS